jgi:hypothetical protein
MPDPAQRTTRVADRPAAVTLSRDSEEQGRRTRHQERENPPVQPRFGGHDLRVFLKTGKPVSCRNGAFQRGEINRNQPGYCNRIESLPRFDWRLP